jgi:hypothetical protein
MNRLLLAAVIGCAMLPGFAPAQDILRGTIAKLDVEKRQIAVTIDGRQREFVLTDDTRVLGAAGKDLAERMKDFRVGVQVFVKPVTRDGREVLEGIKLAEMTAAGGPAQGSPRMMADTSALRPLTELGKGEYHGFTGGLYPEGSNSRPAAHEAAGVKLAAQVRPLNARGEPDPEGRIVLLSIGMSNTAQASQGFQTALRPSEGIHRRLLLVNGAQGGMTAAAIQDPKDGGRGTQYWSVVDERLREAGVTGEQVQAVWIKQADAGPREGFPEYARKLQGELLRVVQVVHQRFPNAKLAYLSGRTYGGYATTPLNPEPYAYESGFSVKWLIEQQIKGDEALNYDPGKGPAKAPWLSWGPYLWANGATKRTDGFSYEKTDFAGDGTHQSSTGQRKVGQLLLDFFRTDATTRPWFMMVRVALPETD